MYCDGNGAKACMDGADIKPCNFNGTLCLHWWRTASVSVTQMAIGCHEIED